MWLMKVWGYLEDRPAELSSKQLPIKKMSIWANVSLKTNMMSEYQLDTTASWQTSLN